MPEVKLAKRMWALGLFVTLLSFNLAYAKATVKEGPSAPSTKERTDKLNEDGATKTLDLSLTKTTVPSENKKASPVKPLAEAVKNCACSCPSPGSGAAATPGAWWNCTRGCLRSWGVSPVQLILCAGVCATGVIPLCALCVGVDVTVMMLCSIGCSTYSGTLEEIDDPHNPILVRKTPRNNGRRAARRTLAFAARR